MLGKINKREWTNNYKGLLLFCTQALYFFAPLGTLYLHHMCTQLLQTVTMYLYPLHLT